MVQQSPNNDNASGFGFVPEISDEEAFNVEIECILTEVATGLDDLFTRANLNMFRELSDVETGIAILQNELFGVLDRPLQKVQTQVGTLSADMMELMDAEVASVAIATEPMVRAAVPEPLQTGTDRGDDPFFNFFASVEEACDDGRNRNINDGRNVDILRFLDENHPSVAALMRSWLINADEQQGHQERSFTLTDGTTFEVWSCGFQGEDDEEEQEDPCRQPDSREGWVKVDLSITEGANVPEATNTFATIIPDLLIPPDGCIWAWVNCDDTRFKCDDVIVMTGGVLRDGTQRIDKYSIAGATEDFCGEGPDGVRTCDTRGSLAEELCKCLQGPRFRGLTVWVDHDTDQIKVQPNGASPPEEPFHPTINISPAGEVTHLESEAAHGGEDGDEEPDIVPDEELVAGPELAGEANMGDIEAVCIIAAGARFESASFSKIKQALMTLAKTAGAAGVLAGFVPFLPAIFKSAPLIGVALVLAVWSMNKAREAARIVCNGDQEYVDLIFARQIYGFFERILPGGLTEQLERQSQQIREKCPWSVPSVEQANRTFLADKISVETWACWVRANGFITENMDLVVEGQRTRPGVNDVNILRRRGILNVNQWIAAIRGLGVTDQAEADQLFELTEQRPGLQDIIRFMVRDAADEDVVRDFQYDKGFDKKYVGILREWGQDQGIPEQVAKFAWRSHWQIPPPTTLYTILNRLGRDSDGDYKLNSLVRIIEALEVQDIAPGWIDDLIKISTRLPTRVDVRRVYRTGIFSEQDVFDNYVQLGYETKAARALTDFTVTEANRLWTNNLQTKRFGRGEITEQELRDVLKELGAVDAAQDLAVRFGRMDMVSRKRKRCLAAVRHRIMLGEITRPEATTEANGILNDTASVAELVDGWFCERAAKSKTLSAAQIIGSFKDGIVDQAALLDQLLNIGYTVDAANDIVNRAALELARRIEKTERLAVEKAFKAAQAQAKENARLENQRVRDATRTEAAREKSQAASRRREGIILDAARMISNRTRLDLTNTYTSMLEQYRLRLRQPGAKADQLADTAKKVAQSTESFSFAAWLNNYVSALADQVAGNGE